MENQPPYLETDTIALEMERFTSLSSEIISLVENLKRKINRSALELQDVQAAVDAGKRELEALCEIERETSSLEQQVEDLGRQKERLQRLIADQQNAWEEEKSRRVLEQSEYEENLKVLWQRDQEAHRLALENERAAALKGLAEELDAMRQESSGTRAAEEKALLAREVAIDRKERELALLMQELEKFLSGLAGRIGPAVQAGLQEPGGADAGFDRERPVVFGAQDDIGGGFNPGNTLLWEDAGERPSH